jgi:hypothetical protein
MKDKLQNNKFNIYINKFFNILTHGNELEIISSDDIINKCVIIEDKNVFFTSTSVNLNHHS